MRYSNMPPSQRAYHRHTHDSSGSTNSLPVALPCRECGEILIHDWKCSIAKTIKGTAWLREEDRVKVDFPQDYTDNENLILLCNQIRNGAYERGLDLTSDCGGQLATG